ncbi:AfsR/SARP family transcriptional regulator [Actinomadura welshii]|uniref:DNA-binding transcriptional activator of the SARP family n=2 Tax=Actinomadura madurae TaxID=1993 RepID=A0A1I5I714_9ACTN|nr:AfsR/SARP family transcriptional regulator [Actinomadura madurae]SFO56317.1 DNA-binding transcriptional activator of the SARP family [Actinomadura madurae]SPT57423.1 Probable regulatory protein embR [Actinomadura madurae]
MVEFARSSEGMRAAQVISVGLLGPFFVAVNGRPTAPTAGRLRVLLAVMALSPGQAVTVDRLAAAAWGEEDRPHNVRRSVQTYIARLRSRFGAAAIGSTAGGYVLCTEPGNVDSLRFLNILSRAGTAATAEAERALLAEALDLWRGEPLEGVPSARLRESEAPWLLERYLTALERRIDLDLAAGRHRELILELSELAARYPLREPLWSRLLIALGRSGRRADALTRYETIRTRLSGELGVDPDPDLQRTYIELLAR